MAALAPGRPQIWRRSWRWWAEKGQRRLRGNCATTRRTSGPEGGGDGRARSRVIQVATRAAGAGKAGGSNRNRRRDKVAAKAGGECFSDIKEASAVMIVRG